MRSIIDEIAQAEEQAEQIRQDAAAAARELLASSKMSAEQEYAHVEEQERIKMRDALDQAEAEGRNQAETVLKELSEAADILCENAQLHLDDAVEYLLKKVQEIV